MRGLVGGVWRVVTLAVLLKMACAKDTIEVFMVCDNACYNKLVDNGVDDINFLGDVSKRLDEIMVDLSVSVVMVGAEIWDKQEKLAAPSSESDLLNSFGAYRKNHQTPKIWSDVSVLITGRDIISLRGIATPSSMCMAENAKAVIWYDGETVNQVANTVAHEIAHVADAEHDVAGCCGPSSINDNDCIMALNPYVLHWMVPRFSSCSINAVAAAKQKPRYGCLADQPSTDKLYDFGLNLCGNGVVDAGETCDCGQSCGHQCCNMATCQLAAGAQCAHGDCCDTSSCQYVSQGTVCSSGQHSVCDPDDTCSGTSGECTKVEAANGVDCLDTHSTAGYCVAGRCATHNQQCHDAWNPGYMMGHNDCYDIAVTGPLSSYAHCGSSSPGTYHFCSLTDTKYYKCGRLQCEFDASSGASETDYDLDRKPMANTFVSGRTCLTGVEYDWEPAKGGHLMVADGTMCGVNKACLDTDCLDKGYVYSMMAQEAAGSHPPVCGDGKIEGSETCDCGPRQCLCCDPDTCQLLAANTDCPNEECKVCDGASSTCMPKSNFVGCSDPTGHCYNGACKSLSLSCKEYFSSDPNADVINPIGYVGYNTQSPPAVQYNGGGYLFLYPSYPSYYEMVFESATAGSDGHCGLLICESSVATTLPNALTFQQGFTTSSVMVYKDVTTSGMTSHGIAVNKYYPLMADVGTPCILAGSQTGYCSHSEVPADPSEEDYQVKTKLVATCLPTN